MMEMTMTVTYRFTDLNALADYFDAKAVDERAKAQRPTSRLKDKHAATERAGVNESVAYMLRNTVLGKD